ncbi:hypothetical protein CP557_02590 [Natrinema ejinorense]|uniref:Uncharacterized protein n=1 Tax=Natrinema ejinorense TaxID=373386 RepID=A0A2A5QRT5_9EURY|nr:hypothetical protein CP557_02590 [Natrinema ejinorense]
MLPADPAVDWWTGTSLAGFSDGVRFWGPETPLSGQRAQQPTIDVSSHVTTTNGKFEPPRVTNTLEYDHDDE